MPKGNEREYFLKQENAFLNLAAFDYVRWNHLNKGRQPYRFISCVVNEMKRRFPYRDIRAIDHVPHTAEEHHEVLFGEAKGRMNERVRHKLNVAKPSMYKGKNKRFVLPVPTGLIEFHEKLETLKSRLRQEGFLQLNQASPYLRDANLLRRTAMIGERTQTWPECDYGAYTELQRQRVLRDIPVRHESQDVE
ncbi:hypothetical protein RhiJN_17667 [Ceratobasidium sp. AG-Ba]|nr:hypothetical protein RhiJN_17667 [Ceratobasidium sp. AG-Ba]